MLGFELNQVTDDPSYSIPWFREAAERGHVIAAHFLARSYTEGVGVPQDPEEAYYWAVITQRGIRESGEDTDFDAEALVSNLAEVLRPEQKMKARRRVADWTPRAADEPVQIK